MAVPGLAPYNAAKYGVVAIMETLHHEMERDPDLTWVYLCFVQEQFAQHSDATNRQMTEAH